MKKFEGKLMMDATKLVRKVVKKDGLYIKIYNL